MVIFPDLKGRTVLVTGGANGIGASIVQAFHEQESHVFFCDIDQKAGEALVAKLGTGVSFRRVDLTKEKEVCRWISRVHEEKGQIDVLVNNAASDPRIALEDTTLKQWDDLFARNLRAYFLTSREATRRMPQGSAIINLASITFHTGPSVMSAYVATKGGVLGFTRSLARELGPRRIRVNTVSPGWVMTERQLREYVTNEAKKQIRNSQCIPDPIQPPEIANVVLFLASNASSAITGQEILADRGWAHS